jgi:CRP-like cAMP-binding protein
MIHNTDYTVEEIEKFIEITRLSYVDSQSKSLHKLMNVKDKISIFKNIEIDDLKTIIYNLKFVKYKENDNIIKQNEISNEMFFIINGVCKVVHNTIDVGKLRAGEVFGESAAIFGTKRNASIYCDSDEVTLLSFSIDHNNMELCSHALATLYKNLASEIDAKLQEINHIHAGSIV